MSNDKNDGPTNAPKSSSSCTVVSKNNNTMCIDLLVGSKMRKSMGASLREHVSAPVSEFAKSQLVKMGWSEGTGLGKNRDGRSTHIRVYKRQDSAGLGSEKSVTSTTSNTDDWWKDGLGDTLAKLSKKKKKDVKYTYTDEELFAATGGARFGMRAGKTRNLAKWRRAESNSSTDEPNIQTSISSDVDAISNRTKNESVKSTVAESLQNSTTETNDNENSQQDVDDSKATKKRKKKVEDRDSDDKHEIKRLKKEKKRLKKEKKRRKQEVCVTVC